MSVSNIRRHFRIARCSVCIFLRLEIGNLEFGVFHGEISFRKFLLSWQNCFVFLDLQNRILGCGFLQVISYWVSDCRSVCLLEGFGVASWPNKKSPSLLVVILRGNHLKITVSVALEQERSRFTMTIRNPDSQKLDGSHGYWIVRWALWLYSKKTFSRNWQLPRISTSLLVSLF